MLDISALGFLDCAGHRVLLEVHARQAEARNRLLVSGPQPPLRQLLGVTGADTRLLRAAEGAPRPRAAAT